MNYYISTTYKINRYRALNLTSIAIVSEDGRELFLEGLSKAKFRKGILLFLSVDKTRRTAYSYCSSDSWVVFCSIFNDVQFFKTYLRYFRDLKFLEDYISEKVGSDFSVIEDSFYPLPDENMTPLQTAKWLKKLHSFLIQFDAKTR